MFTYEAFVVTDPNTGIDWLCVHEPGIGWVGHTDGRSTPTFKSREELANHITA